MKNQMKENRRRGRFALLLANQRGEMFYEVIIKTVIVVVFLLTVLNFYNVFVQYQHTSYICRRVTRAIEVEGAYSSSVTDTFNSLKNELNLSGATMTVSNVTYFHAATKKIQLRNTFTVTVTSTYTMTVFNPVFAPPLQIPITISCKLTGMSEVYHKP